MGSWHAQHSLEVLYSSTSKYLRPWKQIEPHFHDAVAEHAYLIQTLRSSSQLQHHSTGGCTTPAVQPQLAAQADRWHRGAARAVVPELRVAERHHGVRAARGDGADLARHRPLPPHEGVPPQSPLAFPSKEVEGLPQPQQPVARVQAECSPVRHLGGGRREQVRLRAAAISLLSTSASPLPLKPDAEISTPSLIAWARHTARPLQQWRACPLAERQPRSTRPLIPDMLHACSDCGTR